MNPLSDSAPDPDTLRRAIELLFYAYRDFTGEADEVLAQYDLGRAHHRALHFIAGNPGITVMELLAILRITKQSLARVLSALIERGYVVQSTGTRDRRQRHLTLTTEGQALESRIAQVQHAQVASAFRAAGPDAVAGYHKVLEGLLRAEDRAQVLNAIAGVGRAAAAD